MENNIKKIRLVIFNETYWNKGLIYSQNIQPLYRLSKEKGAEFEVISFTSLPMFFRKRKQILKAKRELLLEGIKIKNKFVLVYPHRFFFPSRMMIPFLYMNVFLYILFISWQDRKKDVTLFLRSYQTALFFNKFYKEKNNLIFDTRTDWLEENVNLGRIKRNSITYNYWHKNLRDIVDSFRKTLCISEVCKQNMCNSLGVSDTRIDVIYNPIDYEHFNRPKVKHESVNFLYTGSIGNWNKLENYLDIFKIYNKHNSNSKVYICTATVPSVVNSVLNRQEYDGVRNSIEVHYDVSYDDLPKYYSLCDFGFQLMRIPDSRVGVKFVEYIAAGVTPIINSNVQGAVYLVDKYKMGVVLPDKASEDEIINMIERGKGCIDRSNSEYQAFKELTDINSIVKRYASYL